MQWKQVVLLSMFLIILTMPLAFSTADTTSFCSTQTETQRTDCVEPLQTITPFNQAIISDVNQYVYSWDSFGGHGDIYDFGNLVDVDSDYARLVEVDIDTTILVAFSFQRTFFFDCEAYDYLYCKLEVRGFDNSGISGFAHEDLIFYYRDSPLDYWTEIGTLSEMTSTSYSWDIDVPVDDTFYIMVQSPITTFDWGSANEWRLEYLRVACIDRKSSNVGVRVDKTFDGDNLYPYRGASTNDYYNFECITYNEEGGGLIDYMHLIAKMEGGPYLWGVIWHGTAWTLDVWSEGVNLIESACYVSTSGKYRIAVFAVQLRYDCDQASDIDLQLYHKSDTWQSTRVYDKDYGGRDLDQEPSLAFRIDPALSSRCNPGSSPTLTGSVIFAQSASNITPHTSHTYVQTMRTEPTPSGEWSGGVQIDASGSFAINCLTKGTAGITNAFRIRVYESSSLDEYTGLQGTAQTLCDEVVAYDYGTDNNAIPLGTTTTIYTKLRYKSDNAAITNGFVQWQGLSMDYDADDGRWEAVPPVQNSPTSISYNTLTLITDEGVTKMFAQPSVGVTWTRLNVILHIDAITAISLVSTLYDPKSFVINIWLTDQNGAPVSGWINLTIGGEDFVVFVDETNYTMFAYSPLLAGRYTVEATYRGDFYHEPTYQIMTGFTAICRDISFDNDFPTDMAALVTSQFSLMNVYDNEYQGVFNGVTYIRDYPIDFQLNIWWTLDPEFGQPRNYVGFWNGTSGECTASWVLPWDLDGDGRLRDDDFLCYVVVVLDGLGVYCDVTFHISIQVTQDLDINLDLPTLVFSDTASISINVQASQDPTYNGDYSTYANLFFSYDNETWNLIDTISIGGTGNGALEWECTECGRLYLKCETVPNWRFTQSAVFSECICEKEDTYLTVITVASFTYSDQGILTAYLSTNDNDPLASYAVYLEIFDKAWVSIGSGLTNESGFVNILWIPTLPEGQYLVRARAGLTDSLYYRNPDTSPILLQVRKETLVLSLDDSTISAGFLTAFVSDDEGNPMEGIPVSFFRVGSAEPLGTVVTDSDGCSHFETDFQGTVMMRASVAETDFFYGASEEMAISFPPDMMLITLCALGIFLGSMGIAVVRKLKQSNTKVGPKPIPVEIRKALEEEHELIPERRREETARKIAELDGPDESSPEGDLKDVSGA